MANTFKNAAAADVTSGSYDTLYTTPAATQISAIFFIDLVIKFVLYYMHERLWYNKIKFGRK